MNVCTEEGRGVYSSIDCCFFWEVVDEYIKKRKPSVIIWFFIDHRARPLRGKDGGRGEGNLSAGEVSLRKGARGEPKKRKP